MPPLVFDFDFFRSQQQPFLNPELLCIKLNFNGQGAASLGLCGRRERHAGHVPSRLISAFSTSVIRRTKWSWYVVLCKCMLLTEHRPYLMYRSGLNQLPVFSKYFIYSCFCSNTYLPFIHQSSRLAVVTPSVSSSDNFVQKISFQLLPLLTAFNSIIIIYVLFHSPLPLSLAPPHQSL